MIRKLLVLSKNRLKRFKKLNFQEDMKNMNKIIYVAVSLLLLQVSCTGKTLKSDYKGESFTAEHEQVTKLMIPGIIHCELYDIGGEGIAFYDVDSTNNGSGNLNKGTDSLSTFRINEGMDISYTKFFDSIDNSVFNFVQTKENQLYVG